MSIQKLEPEQKALEINLEDKIYGSFAEIGAGQEVAQYFFKVGASSGTIAKTISAYDKVVSDDIYGEECSGRYICASRLNKMLDHEYALMIERLSKQKEGRLLFAFADTVETLNYFKTNHGNGWMGIRFQLIPEGDYNEILIHLELLDNDTHLQQQAVGILGVNLIYACYNYHYDYKDLICSLMDGLRDRLKIDMLKISGPQFDELDNRLIALEMVRNELTDVAMFDESGNPIHPSEFLYKKNLLVVRGSYRPPTLRTMDRIHSSSQQFLQEKDLSDRGTEIISEITLKDLTFEQEVDKDDYTDRVELLNAIGQKVMVTNCNEYKRLINYLMKYRISKLGIVIGAKGLLEIIQSKYDRNKEGRLLVSFGEIFTRNVRFYIYPSPSSGHEMLMNCRNIDIPPEMKYLYQYILENRHVLDIEDFDPVITGISSYEVRQMIQNNDDEWMKYVTREIKDLIIGKNLFGCNLLNQPNPK